MKQKLDDLIGYTLFLLLFIVLLLPLMVSGAIIRPIRYYKHVADKVNNKKVKEYYY